MKLNRQNGPVLVLFIISLFVGIFNLYDYGLSWDEQVQRDLGKKTYEYVLNDNDDLLSFWERDYGVAIELPLYTVEKLFNVKTTQDIYYLRHFLLHLLFLISAVFLYFLIYDIYKNTTLSVASFLLLICHPRIYAHSFYNSKDIPFLSIMIIATYFLHRLLKNSSKFDVIFFSILSGLLINIRIIGVLLPFYFILTSFINFLKYKERNYLFSAFLVSIIVPLTLYISWPYLWTNPIGHLLTAYENMSKFRWDGFYIFFGDIITKENIPWNYILSYYFITTPIFFTLLAAVGIIGTVIFIFRKKIEVRIIPMFLIVLFVPLLAAILLNSTVYDGWRQFYFIYLPIVFFAISGLHILISNFNYKTIKAITIINLIWLIGFMIYLHPNQGSYFNLHYAFRKPNYLTKNFDVDYWGLSYKSALEFLLEYDDSDTIKYYASSWPGEFNIQSLNPSQQKRLKYVSGEEASYLISDFRWNPNGFPELENGKIYELRKMNTAIQAIYKLRK